MLLKNFIRSKKQFVFSYQGLCQGLRSISNQEVKPISYTVQEVKPISYTVQDSSHLHCGSCGTKYCDLNWP